MPQNHPRITLLLSSAVLASTLTFSGCQHIWNGMLRAISFPIQAKAQVPTPLPLITENHTDDTTQPPGPVSLIPRVIVYRITAPVGTFSTNEKVWSELNEDAISSKMSVLMAQNGLRAGTGSIARWPTIAKLIEGPGVDSGQTVCQTDGRSSLNVITKAGVTSEIVVSIDRDLQQIGRTFDACDNGFKLSMRGIRAKPQLQVQLEPYVALGAVKVVRGEGQVGVVGSNFISEETFGDLQMAAILNADQFLVISPVDAKANHFSIGTLWLSDVDKVPATETILIFVPAPAPAPSK